MMKEKTKKRIYHGISAAFIVAALCFSVFRFQVVFWRLISSIEDLGRSIGYFFTDFVRPSVTDIPESSTALLPLTWEEFKICLDNYWELLFDWRNFLRYVIFILDIIFAVSAAIGPFVISFGAVALVVWIVYGIPDKLPKDETKEGETIEQSRESKPYKWFMRHVAPWTRKARDFIKGYFDFLSPEETRWYKRWYKNALVLIWLYNLNIVTIMLEVAAFIFFFLKSWDFVSIYTLVVKALLDLTVALEFLPTIIEVVIGYKIFDWFRHRLGKKSRMNKYKKTEKFLEDYPGALFIVGKQRSKKTSLLTQLKCVEERRFRNKADEKMAERDKQFPFFPWAIFERTVDRCRDKQFIVLEDIKFFALYVKRAYEAREDARRFRGLSAYLETEYGFEIADVINYAKVYPMVYKAGPTDVSLFKAIERYMMLYLINSQPSTLDISNFSIREDFTFKDYGFFRVFDGKPFRESSDSRKNEQYSHCMNYDAFRPGEAFDQETRYDEAVEYGIGVCQEFSKERKNQKTRAQQQQLEERKATQNNDGFELDTKMRGHVATIDNFDFWRWLFDDQRADALGADNKDMTTQATIKKTSAGKIVLPFFGIDELVYVLASKFRDGFHYLTKNKKKGKTLLDYFINLVYQPFFHHYDCVKNRYTVYALKLKIVDGCDQEIFDAGLKLYVIHAFTYNDRFATDSARVFYEEKHRKAKRGLNKIEQYEGLYPTSRNFTNHRSYFVEEMKAHYGDHSRVVIPKETKGKGKGT